MADEFDRRLSSDLLRTLVVAFTILSLFVSVSSAQPSAPRKKQPRRKINLGFYINSRYSELAPIISPNGKFLYFTMGKEHPSNLGEEHLQDCYVSKLLPNGTWSAPRNLGSPINSTGNDAIAGVSPDGRTLFIKNFFYNRTSGLCFARMDSLGKWQITPVTILEYSNSSKLSSQCISVNGDFIITSLEREDGYGGLDLYVSHIVDREKGIYSKPQNLGIVINTKEDEFAPFLAADTKTLYFSSRGHGGYGDADVFMTKRLDDSWVNWTAPRNLGQEVNTPGMDAYYSVPASGKEAYFSSMNGPNLLDLYKIELLPEEQPDPVLLLSGTVLNRKGDVIHAQIVATDLKMNMEIARSESSDQMGDFSLVLPAGNDYRLSVAAPGYLPYSTELDISNSVLFQDTSITILLDSVGIGSSATIEDIFFDFNRSTLKPESDFSLDGLSNLLQSNPSWIVKIEGYTDSIGSQEANKKLSLDRAQAVVDYLVSKGVNRDRLQAEGFGAESPVAENSTDEGRRKNRRVEFRIVRMGSDK